MRTISFYIGNILNLSFEGAGRSILDLAKLIATCEKDAFERPLIHPGMYQLGELYHRLNLNVFSCLRYIDGKKKPFFVILPCEISCQFLSYISFCGHLMVDSFIVEKESRQRTEKRWHVKSVLRNLKFCLLTIIIYSDI